MINILTGYGAEKLDRVESIKLYVGGIPVNPEPPLNYNVVFSLEGVFDHYTDPSHVIRNGELKEIPSLSEIETIEFRQIRRIRGFSYIGRYIDFDESFRMWKHLNIRRFVIKAMQKSSSCSLIWITRP